MRFRFGNWWFNSLDDALLSISRDIRNLLPTIAIHLILHYAILRHSGQSTRPQEASRRMTSTLNKTGESTTPASDSEVKRKEKDKLEPNFSSVQDQ